MSFSLPGFGGTAPKAPTLGEVFDIPEHQGDTFVLKLENSVAEDKLRQTVSSYVVTDEIAHNLDTAMDFVETAFTRNESQAVYLHGSFGSGKSHFMAVLYALLSGAPITREVPELQPIAAEHADLAGKNLLQLTYHFLDSKSVEDTLFRGYLRQIKRLHPDAPAPVLHTAGELFENAANHRSALGDEAFFASLNQATAMPGGSGRSAKAKATGLDFGALTGEDSTRWDPASYEAAMSADADERSRTAVIQALTQTMFSAYATTSPWLGMAEGLKVISEHAKTLGYDGVIFYLDELILWLMFMIPTRAEFNKEAQKLTLLVENEFGAALPMVFFIARQFDLSTWQDTSIESGADLEARQQAFNHQGGRFHTIVLGDKNLPQIANRRLLQPRSAQAKMQLDEAFDKLNLNQDISTVLLDGVNTSEKHSSSTMAQFRLTYPFSPALVDTLVALSSIMQRERTALKVMEQLLIDNRDTMTIDRIIPVGESFDYLLEGDKHISRQGGEAFRLGRKFWSEQLRPHILNKYSIPTDTADKDLPAELSGLHAELRIGKTLILAGIAPEVPALKSMTVSRLAHLNHGSMVTLFKNDSLSQTMELVREWAREFTEIVIQPGTNDPVISVRLDEVPWKDLVEQAQREDTDERRRLKIRSLLTRALRVAEVAPAVDGSLTRTVTWRGTARRVEVIFGNVRDQANLKDSDFRPFQSQALRLVVDYPFDEAGHTPAEDHQRVDQLRVSDGEAPFTVVWLPQFFSNEQMAKLGELVIIEHLLSNNGWRDYTTRIAEDSRESIKQILRSRAETLNTSLERELAEAYGAQSGVTFAEGQEPLKSLDPSISVSKPSGADFTDAGDRLIESLFTARYPSHPRFDSERLLTTSDFNRVADALRRAAGDRAFRTDLTPDERKAARAILPPLNLAQVFETHLIFNEDTHGKKLTDIDTQLRRTGLNPTETVSVQAVANAVEQLHPNAGLNQDTIHLYVVAWAAARNRSWAHHGSTLSVEPTLKDIDPRMDLQPVALPDPQQWSNAVEAAGLLFGINLNSHLTGANLKELQNQVTDKATALRSAAQALATEVSSFNAFIGITEESNRSRLAGELNTLIDQLARDASSGLKVVGHLSSTVEHHPQGGTTVCGSTSLEALESLNTAEKVTGLLRRFRVESHAGNFDTLRGHAATHPDNDGGAQMVVDKFRKAISEHEFVHRAAAAIRTFGEDFSRWASDMLGKQTTPPVTPPVDPPVNPLGDTDPDPTPNPTPARTFKVSDPRDLTEVKASLDELAGQNRTFTITVTWENE